ERKQVIHLIARYKARHPISGCRRLQRHVCGRRGSSQKTNSPMLRTAVAVSMKKEILMKGTDATRDMDVQAAKALALLLGQMSSIKTKDIRFKSAGPHRCDILAEIDVLGHNHKLVCRVADGESSDVHNTIKKLR